MNELQWWGYRHTSGTLHTKRYFDQLDIQEANESPFCARVIGPFNADSSEAARRIVKDKLGLPHE